MATDLGKVGIRMRGDWNSSATYEVLDAVTYSSKLYIAKQDVPANTAPTYTEYWQLCYDATNKADKVSEAVTGDFAALDSNGNLANSEVKVDSVKKTSVNLTINSTDKVKITTSPGTNAHLVILKRNRDQLYVAFLVVGFSGGSTRNNILILEKGTDVDAIQIETTASTDYDVIVSFTGTFTDRATTVTAIPFATKTFAISKITS